MIRRFFARRRLAKLVRAERARNHQWSLNRLAQLTGERRERFARAMERAL